MDSFDGMVIVGSLLITVGVGLLSLPGGLIVGGLLMACAGVLGAAKKGKASLSPSPFPNGNGDAAAGMGRAPSGVRSGEER